MLISRAGNRSRDAAEVEQELPPSFTYSVFVAPKFFEGIIALKDEVDKFDFRSEESAVDFSCEHLPLGVCGVSLRFLGQQTSASARRSETAVMFCNITQLVQLKQH